MTEQPLTRRAAREAREAQEDAARALRIPRQRRAAMAAALTIPVLASVASTPDAAVFHEPDQQDLSTTTGSIQAVQTVPVQMDPTADVVEVPAAAALSVQDARDAISAAQQARDEAARQAERASREASAAHAQRTAHATPTPSATPTPIRTKTPTPAPEPEPEAPTPAASSSRGAAVIAAAKRHLGVPYVWGGESLAEGGFDCSGLTQWSYEQVGVNLPRTAAQQQRATTRVTWSQARPGDLVFWGSPAHHVGIYLGDGLVLSAPKRGDVVKIQAVWGDPTVRRVS